MIILKFWIPKFHVWNITNTPPCILHIKFNLITINCVYKKSIIHDEGFWVRFEFSWANIFIPAFFNDIFFYKNLQPRLILIFLIMRGPFIRLSFNFSLLILHRSLYISAGRRVSSIILSMLQATNYYNSPMNSSSRLLGKITTIYTTRKQLKNLKELQRINQS
jgi:hypothetical protein